MIGTITPVFKAMAIIAPLASIPEQPPQLFQDFINATKLRVQMVPEQDMNKLASAPYRREQTRNGVVPGIKDLPKSVQYFLSSINGYDPYKKAESINNYINKKIKYEEQPENTPEDVKSFNQIIKSGKGDCDDYAYSKAVLLKNAGFDDVYILGAQVRYTVTAGSSSPDPHTLTIVKLKDEFYALDSVAGDIYALDRDLRSKRSDLELPFTPENKAQGGASVQITRILGLSDLSTNNKEYYWAPLKYQP